jgi:hypothetical protein
MHLLSIVFGPTPTAWAMLFQKPELADKAFFDLEVAKRERKETVSVFDEYGQRAVFETVEIHGFMLEDLEKSKVAQIERGLHQARTQARAQQQAAADPILSNAARIQGAPVLQPMGNGRFNG